LFIFVAESKHDNKIEIKQKKYPAVARQGQSHIYLTREGVYKSYLIPFTLKEAESEINIA
jgi:hypothetical protein